MPLSYNEALDYLYSFIDYEVKRHLRYTPDVISLDRPRRLAAALGNPHESYPIIHITGTKGKGSTGAICMSVCRAAGLKTALYTSPHLQDFRERLRVDGAMIPKETLAALVEEIQPVVAETVPDVTWFELMTVLAFLYYAREAVDIAVVEVGLGGRLDSTNIVTPLASVITSLSYDHTYLLGDTLADIAREKGGIIKPGVPVVSAPQPPEALDVLERIAAERSAPLILVGHDWTYTPGVATETGQTFRAGPAGGPQVEYYTPLLGLHQVINGTVALAALDQVARQGLDIGGAGAAQAGLRQVEWPGRLEVIQREPRVVLDAAHNAESACRLRDALRDLFPHKRLFLIYGASVDKNITGMFEALLPMIHHLILTQAVHPRAHEPSDLAELACAVDPTVETSCIGVVAKAVEHALSLAGPDDLICVTGSLFVVGEVRDMYGLPPCSVAKLDVEPSKPVGGSI
ncbi:MAG: bifunctional folylpolyglutamate synthase/dihydrofolate synthase [Anaerolineae bacterium]|nr:bifunctional folylpolyglutamate synthase/dihydrofolate synthase [Anaerolineae bacterium]